MSNQNLKKKFASLFGWDTAVLGLLLVVIFLFNYWGGQYLLTNDNYSPELNPKLSIVRSLLTPAWRGYRALGVTSDSEQADLFRSFIYYCLDLFFPKYLLAQLYAFISLLAGVIGVSFLGKKVTRHWSIKVDENGLGLMCGFFYLTTLWTSWIFTFPLMPYVSQFGFLPWLVLAVFNYMNIRSSRSGLQLILALALFASTAVVATLFIASFVFIAFIAFCLIFMQENLKVGVLRFAKCILIVLIFNSFWILPFFSYVKESSSQIRSSSINKLFTTQSIAGEEQRMTAENALRFYTSYLYLADSNAQSGTEIFRDADLYKSDRRYQALSYLPALLLIVAFIAALYTRKLGMMIFIAVAFFGWMGIKNSNPPFGEIYSFLQDHSELFRQSLRWPTSKFGGVFLLGLTLCAGFGAVYLAGGISSLFPRKQAKVPLYLLLGAIVALQLFYAGYLLTGNLYAERSYTSLPGEYYDLSEFLTKNDPSSRVVQMPPPNNNYFREYSYGFIGSGFLHYMVPNPILERALAIGSDSSDRAETDIQDLYYSGRFDELDRLFDKYEIEFIFVDSEMIAGRYGAEINWEQLGDMLQRYEQVWSAGSLALYRTSYLDEESSLITELVSNHDSKYTGDAVYNRNSESKTNSGGLVKPLYLLVKNPEITEEGVIALTDYKSNISRRIKVSSDVTTNSPSELYLNRGSDSIELRPGLPKLSNTAYETEIKKYSYSEAAIAYGIKSNLVFATDLISPYTVDTMYKDAGNIAEFSSIRPQVDNLLKKFKYSPPQDCSGAGANSRVRVIPTSRGFAVSANDALGCVSVPLVVQSEAAAILDITWEADTGALVGYCVFSQSLGRCLDGTRYYYTNGLEPQSRQIKFKRVLTPSENYTVYLYVQAQDKQQDVQFTTVRLTKYQVKRALAPKLDISLIELGKRIIDGSETVQLSVPIIHGVDEYRFDPENGDILNIDQRSYPDLESDFFVGIEDGSLVQSAEGGYVHQYGSLLGSSGGQSYFFTWEGENVAGVTAQFCLYTDGDRCSTLGVLDELTKTSKSGLMSSTAGTNYLGSWFKSEGYKKPSVNKLSGFVVFKIPEVWKEFSFEIGDANILISNEAESLAFEGVSYGYQAAVTSGEYAVDIPEASAHGWNAYVVNKDGVYSRLPLPVRAVLLSLFGEKVNGDSKIVVNGWKQGWVIDGDEIGPDKTIDIIYTPNSLGYIGYGLIVMLVLYYLGLNLKELIWGRGYERGEWQPEEKHNLNDIVENV